VTDLSPAEQAERALQALQRSYLVHVVPPGPGPLFLALTPNEAEHVTLIQDRAAAALGVARDSFEITGVERAD
jgi:hypothetical protein